VDRRRRSNAWGRLEAIVNGRYYWIPFQRIHTLCWNRLLILRDYVWMPAQFTWANSGEDRWPDSGALPRFARQRRSAGATGAQDRMARNVKPESGWGWDSAFWPLTRVNIRCWMCGGLN
jgi:hypothetical protein